MRQLSEEERRIAGLFREGKAAEAIAAKREDNTVELAPGGYRAAIERVADLYAERRRAAHNQGPDYRITISAPTNVDAREISRAVRERRREMGEVGADQVDLAATDGRGNGYTLALAGGDNVRLFERTRAVFTDERGRRKSANIGDNGSVLRVEAVLPAEGLILRGESGKTGFVSWEALHERGGTGRLLLGYGDCLTIDSSQGITSDEHINALPAGSRAVQGFKAYVAESRHRVHSWLVGSMGAEMREARERRPAGLPELTPEQVSREAWGNLVRNLEKQPAKESALAFLERATAGKRETAKAFQGTLRRHEARVAAGESATTLRRTAQAKQVRAALPRIAEGIEEAARQRAVVAESLRAVPVYWADKERRRVEVAARLVAEGKLPFGKAAERIAAAELADQRRGLAPDPIHGTRKLSKGMDDVDEVKRRIGARLKAAIIAYKEQKSMVSAAPVSHVTERQGAAASA